MVGFQSTDPDSNNDKVEKQLEYEMATGFISFGV